MYVVRCLTVHEWGSAGRRTKRKKNMTNHPTACQKEKKAQENRNAATQCAPRACRNAKSHTAGCGAHDRQKNTLIAHIGLYPQRREKGAQRSPDAACHRSPDAMLVPVTSSLLRPSCFQLRPAASFISCFFSTDFGYAQATVHAHPSSRGGHTGKVERELLRGTVRH